MIRRIWENSMGLYKRKDSPNWWGKKQITGKLQYIDTKIEKKEKYRGQAQRIFDAWAATLGTGKPGAEAVRDITYGAAKESFKTHTARLKPKSQKRYLTSLVALDRTYPDTIMMSQIGGGELHRHWEIREREGVTTTSIRRDFACLSSLFTVIENKEQFTGPNPVPKFLKKNRLTLTEGEARTRYLSVAEEAQFLKLIDEVIKTKKMPRHRWAYTRLRYAVPLVIDTGLRMEEVCSLTWRDVDLTQLRIRVRGDVSKNHRERFIPIPPRTAKILSTIERNPHTDYVFWHSKAGKRYDNFDRLFRAVVTFGKIANLIFHDLRRTAGCRWLQVYRLRIETVSKLLGHSDIKVTQRSYAFLHIDQIEAEIKDSQFVRAESFGVAEESMPHRQVTISQDEYDRLVAAAQTVTERGQSAADYGVGDVDTGGSSE